MIDPSEQGTSSVVAPKQTIIASTQATPSVVVFQEFTINKSAKKLPLTPTLQLKTFHQQAQPIKAYSRPLLPAKGKKLP